MTSSLLEKLSPPSVSLIASKIGGKNEDWTIREIGDGNVNLIYCVEGPKGKVLVKKAVPYLRCVGEAWPLDLNRNFFEYQALKAHGEFAPDYLPKVFIFDEGSAAMVMEFLDEHIILRKGVIQGKKYPKFTEHITDYMARTLFFTSDIYLGAGEKKRKMKLFCDNVDLCKITEDLIFTDPYREAEQNRWNKPLLDPIAREFFKDVHLKVAITKLKEKFLNSTQALIHGDLHTGSIMINENETKVIDPEFAFYGPMGFDVGLLLANFFMGFFSQAGHGSTVDARLSYEDWLLNQVQEIWDKFSHKFSALWETDLKGDFLPERLFYGVNRTEVIAHVRRDYLQNLFCDSVGFAATEMIRRTLGLAHVADMDTIEDTRLRALCEYRNLVAARELLLRFSEIKTLEEVLSIVKKARKVPAIV